jgi:prolyl 4-hydroxylase
LYESPADTVVMTVLRKLLAQACQFTTCDGRAPTVVAVQHAINVAQYPVGGFLEQHRDVMPIERYLTVWDIASNTYHQVPPNHAFTKGKRYVTALMYLNEAYEGGETLFPVSNTTVTPATGKLILFDNLDRRGKELLNSLHCGGMVTQGEKWIAGCCFLVG